MEKIKVWTSGNKHDINMYAYLAELEAVTGIKVDLDNAPFGIGGTGTLIQADGIEWFLEQRPEIRLVLPEWVLTRLGAVKLETSEDKLNHVLQRLKKVTELTEYNRDKSIPFDVLYEECLTLIEEIETGVVVDRSLVNQ